MSEPVGGKYPKLRYLIQNFHRDVCDEGPLESCKECASAREELAAAERLARDVEERMACGHRKIEEYMNLEAAPANTVPSHYCRICREIESVKVDCLLDGAEESIFQLAETRLKELREPVNRETNANAEAGNSEASQDATSAQVPSNLSELQAASSLPTPAANTNGVAIFLLRRGILAMNGSARIGWANDVRKFLAALSAPAPQQGSGDEAIAASLARIVSQHQFWDTDDLTQCSCGSKFENDEDYTLHISMVIRAALSRASAKGSEREGK